MDYHGHTAPPNSTTLTARPTVPGDVALPHVLELVQADSETRDSDKSDSSVLSPVLLTTPY